MDFITVVDSYLPHATPTSELCQAVSTFQLSENFIDVGSLQAGGTHEVLSRLVSYIKIISQWVRSLPLLNYTRNNMKMCIGLW